MTSTIGKYATEVAVIKCPECGEENQIVDEDYPEWECSGCGFEPEWNQDEWDEDFRECLWCSKEIEELSKRLFRCRSCTIESQRRAKLRRAQCCPHCDERLTADDLRKIKEARREARERMEEVASE